MSNKTMLFCPFCREPFDDIARCPTHDLALVDLQHLPPDQYDQEVPPELLGQPISGANFRYGRGPLFFGSMLYLLSFPLDFVRIQSVTQTHAYSTFEAALTRAPNLWSVPFAAVVLVGILWRKRTLAELAGVRFATLCISVVPLVAALYSLMRVTKAADATQLVAQPGPALGLVALGALLTAYGSFRLGRVKTEPSSTSR